MRPSHAAPAMSAVFDDPNLVSCAGLAPVMALAARCELSELVAERLTLQATGGVNAPLKVGALIAGMVAGADSITDMDLLRHGAMGRLFSGVRAPSTLGTFLRSFSYGHVRQLDSVAAAFTVALAGQSPILTGAAQLTYVDIDDTIRQTYGYTKQGAGYGYSGVKGLNALIVTASTPLAAPVIVACRLRRGPANSAKGAAGLLTRALNTTRKAGAGPAGGSGLLIVRADSAFYGYEIIDAARRAGARFSITARNNPAVRRAIAAIPETDWTPIHYPQAVWDDQLGAWISDAEVAETTLTAFTSRRKGEQIDGRLIARRVRRLQAAPTRTDDNATNTTNSDGAQGELFVPEQSYRYHAVFTNSPLSMLEAEKAHRAHAIIETVISDLKNGPLAHLPSASFAANDAWLTLATIAYNLTRAAGALAGGLLARATTGTVRARLINVPARLARSARKLVLHLPRDWPWEPAWNLLFEQATRPAPT